MNEARLPLVLAVLGVAVPLAGSGFAVWGMALLWLAAIAAFAVARLVLREPTMLVFIDAIALVMTGAVLAVEGGWWLVPAVAAQIAVDRRTATAAAAHR